ncbi:hypothetical protein CBM2606_A100013 [Cupriavidus taiwanensis]|nr:hypothetical protein CBM2606_A100013 [Cupriavidus taiwanensis]
MGAGRAEPHPAALPAGLPGIRSDPVADHARVAVRLDQPVRRYHQRREASELLPLAGADLCRDADHAPGNRAALRDRRRRHAVRPAGHRPLPRRPANVVGSAGHGSGVRDVARVAPSGAGSGIAETRPAGAALDRHGAAVSGSRAARRRRLCGMSRVEEQRDNTRSLSVPGTEGAPRKRGRPTGKKSQRSLGRNDMSPEADQDPEPDSISVPHRLTQAHCDLRKNLLGSSAHLPIPARRNPRRFDIDDGAPALTSRTRVRNMPCHRGCNGPGGRLASEQHQRSGLLRNPPGICEVRMRLRVCRPEVHHLLL